MSMKDFAKIVIFGSLFWLILLGAVAAFLQVPNLFYMLSTSSLVVVGLSFLYLYKFALETKPKRLTQANTLLTIAVIFLSMGALTV